MMMDEVIPKDRAMLPPSKEKNGNTYTRKSTSLNKGYSQQPVLLKSDTRISKVETKPKRLQQVYFKTSNNRVTCPLCNMSYVPLLKPDNELHQKFHQRSLIGREWLSNWGQKLYDFRIDINGKSEIGTLLEVNIQNKSEVRATKELLELVNSELQAPDDCGHWLQGKEFGKVFICVLNKRAIGIVCLERITRGEWLILETGNIVPNQSIPLVVGISRIYVVRNFRRLHIGSELLCCVRKHFIYGTELKKASIGWSQPSEFGSKLAKSFNAIRHKSGHNLLPIYLEN